VTSIQTSLFFLPSQSQAQNPDEYLNCDLKDSVHSSAPARIKEQLHKKNSFTLKDASEKTKQAAKYLKHQKSAYAA